MSDRLEFEIIVAGQTDGAKKAAQEIRKTAEEANKAVKESAKATKESAQAEDEAAKKTGFLSLKKAELKKIVRELAHDFPIAGLAAKAMLNPIVFTFTTAIALFSKAKDKLADWNAEMDEAQKRAASADFADGMKAKKEAMAAASTEAAGFSEKLRNIAESEDNVKQRFQDATDKLHEFANAMAEISSAGEARDLAKVDLLRKMGKLTEFEAISQRGTIHEKYRKEREGQKSATENQELQLTEKELSERLGAAGGLADSAAATKRHRDEVKARQAQAKADLAAGEGKVQEYDQALVKAEEEVEKTKRWYERARGLAKVFGMSDAPASSPDRKRYEEAIQKAERARQDKIRQQGLNERNRTIIGETGQLLPGLDADAAVADERLTGNARRIVQIETTLPGQRQAIQIRQAGRAAASGLQGQTAAMGTMGDVAGQYGAVAEGLATAAGSGNIGGMAASMAQLAQLAVVMVQFSDALKAATSMTQGAMTAVQQFTQQQQSVIKNLRNP